MLVFKKRVFPIELLNLTLSGLILAGLLWPKSKTGVWVFGAGRDYQVLESRLNMEMKQNRVPSLKLVIVSQGHIIYQQGFGNEATATHIPVEEKSLLKSTSFGKTGLLRSKTGDFRWQWGITDGYGKMMITDPALQAGVIIFLDRHTGIEQAGKLAVNTVNEYWGVDLDPKAFNEL